MVDTASSTAAYLLWTSSLGVLHPSLEVFSLPNALTLRATRPIPTSKAFLFVPHQICISIPTTELALNALFASEPEIYALNPRKNEYKLCTFLIYEKLKGEEGFYWPYLKVIHGLEGVMDWNDAEIRELQDGNIKNRVNAWKKDLKMSWKELKPVLLRHKEDFQTGENLEEVFTWAYKVVQTRRVAGMLVPMMELVQRTDISTNFETLPHQYLSENASNSGLSIDYSDFCSFPPVSFPTSTFTLPSFRNKLAKFVSKSGWETVHSLDAIWNIDEVVEEESSSDEDLGVNSACEDAVVPSSERAYWVVSTGVKGSFQSGEQVAVANGGRNNTDLLLYTGQVPERNYRDSVLVSVQNASFGVKWNRLNEEVVGWFRRELVQELVRQGVFKTEVGEVLGGKPVLAGVETAVLGKVGEYYKLLCRERFRTSEEEDRAILSINPVSRLKTAIFYRISQRRILTRQILLIDTLLSVLALIKQGTWTNSLAEKSTTEVENLYPLRKYLRDFENNRQIWTNSFKSS